MIQQVSDNWGGVEKEAKSLTDLPPEKHQVLMKSIAGVRAALQTMCEVSVSKKTLAEAVRAALPPILQDELRQAGAAELFPALHQEVLDLRARVEEVSAAVAAKPLAPAVPAGEAVGLVEETLEREASDAPFRSEVIARLGDFEARIRRLGELDEELKTVKDGVDLVDGRVGAVEGRLDGVEGRLQRVESRLQEVDDRSQAGGARAQDRLEELSGSVAGFSSRLDDIAEQFRGASDESARRTEESQRRWDEISAFRTGIEGQLRGGLLVVEERVEEAKKYFTGLLARLEASVPETARREAGVLEAQLRKEIDEMVQSLDGKLAELRGMLARLEDVLPRREAVQAVDDRLGRVEASLDKVSSHVSGIDSLAPELGRIREELGAVSTGLGDAGHGLGELRTAVSGGLSELKSLVDLGIQRWEADQSQMLERVSTIRDTLRDQLQKVSQQVTEQNRSIWGKLTGKGEGGLKMSREEWETLAGKIEGIVSGLESILAARRGG